MHAHAYYNVNMRTTIEITNEQRNQLVTLAAKRNQKGFSGLVREALEQYLNSQFNSNDKVENALLQKGVLSDEDADAFVKTAGELRTSWR